MDGGDGLAGQNDGTAAEEWVAGGAACRRAVARGKRKGEEQAAGEGGGWARRSLRDGAMEGKGKIEERDRALSLAAMWSVVAARGNKRER